MIYIKLITSWKSLYFTSFDESSTSLPGYQEKLPDETKNQRLGEDGTDKLRKEQTHLR